MNSTGWFEVSPTVEVKSFVGNVAADFHTLSQSSHAYSGLC